LAGCFKWVYRRKWKKVTKKGRQNFFGREFVEIGLRPKKNDRQIFLAAPPFQISKCATDSNPDARNKFLFSVLGLQTQKLSLLDISFSKAGLSSELVNLLRLQHLDADCFDKMTAHNEQV
jgi:hypothetical protein